MPLPVETVVVVFTVKLLLNVLVPPPEKVRLLKVVEEAEIDCADVPLKITILRFGTKLLPVPVQLPATEMVEEPPLRVPAVKATEEKEWLRFVPMFKVPPKPLMMSAPVPTFPEKVAVPLVLAMVMVPVVLNPEIL